MLLETVHVVDLREDLTSVLFNAFFCLWPWVLADIAAIYCTIKTVWSMYCPIRSWIWHWAMRCWSWLGHVSVTIRCQCWHTGTFKKKVTEDVFLFS